jgi:hypothetical protein
MRTISVSVSEEDYESFRRAAARERRPIAQLIREAMSEYRLRKLGERLEHLPLLVGHRQIGEFPTRAEVYDEVFGHR